jgi:DNA polymerase-3 subunit epsilon
METERPDLTEYINLFGYDPRYGPPKPRISSVRYEPQPYQRRKLLYE